jgi:hypothetical protein
MDPNEPGKDNDCTIGKPYLRFHPVSVHSYHRRRRIPLSVTLLIM